MKTEKLKTLKEMFSGVWATDKGCYDTRTPLRKELSILLRKMHRESTATKQPLIEELFQSQLRAEAVKWVKAMENEEYIVDSSFEPTSVEMNFMRHFFNLTEDDLK